MAPAPRNRAPRLRNSQAQRGREREQRVDPVGLPDVQPVAVEKDRAQPDRPRPVDVVRDGVADHRRLGDLRVERCERRLEDRTMGLDAPVRERPHAHVDVEAVVTSEFLEVALSVRYERDPEAVGPERLEGGEGVVVEEEVLVPLPFADELHGARA